ncbi:MAG: hypothetical protein ABIJ57_10915 [Pseudomonadota bacterium]
MPMGAIQYGGRPNPLEGVFGQLGDAFSQAMARRKQQQRMQSTLESIIGYQGPGDAVSQEEPSGTLSSLISGDIPQELTGALVDPTGMSSFGGPAPPGLESSLPQQKYSGPLLLPDGPQSEPRGFPKTRGDFLERLLQSGNVAAQDLPYWMEMAKTLPEGSAGGDGFQWQKGVGAGGEDVYGVFNKATGQFEQMQTGPAPAPKSSPTYRTVKAGPDDPHGFPVSTVYKVNQLTQEPEILIQSKQAGFTPISFYMKLPSGGVRTVTAKTQEETNSFEADPAWTRGELKADPTAKGENAPKVYPLTLYKMEKGQETPSEVIAYSPDEAMAYIEKQGFSRVKPGKIADLKPGEKIKMYRTTPEGNIEERDVQVIREAEFSVKGWKVGEFRGQTPQQQEAALRDDFTRLSADFNVVKSQYSNVIGSSEMKSAAGDVSLIFSFMKILDPNSVVRESEYATAENAGSVPERVWRWYNKALGGQKLAPTMREDFLEASKRLFSERARAHEKTTGEFKRIAKSYNLDPTRVIVDFTIPTQVGDRAKRILGDYDF